jgi:hypothetical protein
MAIYDEEGLPVWHAIRARLNAELEEDTSAWSTEHHSLQVTVEDGDHICKLFARSLPFHVQIKPASEEMPETTHSKASDLIARVEDLVERLRTEPPIPQEPEHIWSMGTSEEGAPCICTLDGAIDQQATSVALAELMIVFHKLHGNEGPAPSTEFHTWLEAREVRREALSNPAEKIRS